MGFALIAGLSLRVVTLPTEIDISNAGQVRSDLADACAPHTAVVLADMTRTTFCDSTGMTAIALAQKRAARQGISLSVVIASAAVGRVFRLLGLDSIMPAYHSLDDALAATGATPPQP